MALDFFAGCVGGGAGVIVGHPLDTVKVRLQTQDPTNLKYRGTFHCLSSIIKKESVSGLYKGISSPLVGVAGVNAIIFGVYGALRPYVSGSPGNDALWAHFAAGSISGAVQSVVASPMELVKTRMQINEDNAGSRKVGPVDVLKGIYQNEGGLLRGVFKGWGITLGREVPGFGFYFASYEALTRFGDGQVGTLGMMLAGGMAGVISWIVTFPIDVVKTRLQCDDRGKYRGIIDCVRKTYSSEGYRAFTRGLVSTVIRAFPTNAATFTVVTWVMRFADDTAPVDDVQNTKQYLDELLNKTSKLQGKFEDSLRLKVPQYLFYGNSFASGSLASQCAASAQKYADKTQVYFNFYQSLQYQVASMAQNKVADSEEEGEEKCVGVEKKQRVALLRDTLAMHMHADKDDHEDNHVISFSGEKAGHDMQEVSNHQHTCQEDESVSCTLSSRSDQGASAIIANNDYSNKPHHYLNNRKEDNAVVHNNHILSTSSSCSSAIINENPFERETNANPVNTVSCEATTTTISTKKANDVADSHLSSTGSPIHGNDRLSHEATSFPVQVMKSGMVTTTGATTSSSDRSNDYDNTTTGATGKHKNAAEYLSNSDEDSNDNDSQSLSSKDLTYLSKSLDIPAHIINAANLQQKYSCSRTSETCQNVKNKEKKTVSATSTPALTRVAAGKSNSSSNSKRAQAWRKYCKTPALELCTCFEDHCVCYL